MVLKLKSEYSGNKYETLTNINSVFFLVGTAVN